MFNKQCQQRYQSQSDSMSVIKIIALFWYQYENATSTFTAMFKLFMNKYKVEVTH